MRLNSGHKQNRNETQADTCLKLALISFLTCRVRPERSEAGLAAVVTAAAGGVAATAAAAVVAAHQEGAFCGRGAWSSLVESLPPIITNRQTSVVSLIGCVSELWLGCLELIG